MDKTLRYMAYKGIIVAEGSRVFDLIFNHHGIEIVMGVDGRLRFNMPLNRDKPCEEMQTLYEYYYAYIN